MNVLIISQHFWPEEFKVNDVAFELAARKHHVTVFTAKPNYPKGTFYSGYSFWGKSKETIQGVTVIRVPVIPRKSGNAFHLILNYSSFVFFSFWGFLFRIRNRYDIILVHMTSPIFSALPGVWIKRKYNIPMILWVLDLWPESLEAASNIKSPGILSLIGIIVKRIYKFSDKILISSMSFEKSIAEKTKNKPVIFFPNWAEDVFTTVPWEHIVAEKLPEGFNIVFAGNIGEAQDFEAIVEAATLTQHNGINWIIVGEGRKLAWLKNEIKRQHISNMFLKGCYPVTKMPEFFKSADAMLVSLKNEPIFALTVPAKVQAYMASGKIILGMLNGEGAKVITQANCGFVVNAGDYSSLAKASVKISLMTPEERRQLEANGKNFYEKNYNKTKQINHLEKILTDTLQNYTRQLI